jgi:hypothetical protein
MIASKESTAAASPSGTDMQSVLHERIQIPLLLSVSISARISPSLILSPTFF